MIYMPDQLIDDQIGFVDIRQDVFIAIITGIQPL